MKNIDVSIVVPCFNHELFIKDTITSIAATGLALEIIIIDDGSTDQTYEIACDIVSKLNSDISVHCEKNKNQGLIKSLNRGFDLARGDIIGQIASDDLYTTRQIEESYNKFSNSKDIGVVFSIPKTIDEKNNIGDVLCRNNTFLSNILSDRKKTYQALLRKNFLPGSTIFYSKEALQTCGRMNPLLINRGEISLHWKIAQKYKFSCLEDSYGYYRIHQASTWLAMQKDIDRMRDNFLKLLNSHFLISGDDENLKNEVVKYVKYDYKKMKIANTNSKLDKFKILTDIAFNDSKYLISDIKKKLG